MTAGSKPETRRASSTRDSGAPATPSRRVRVAEGLAVVALLAAFVGALGPADEVRTTYSWPPRTLPTRMPERLWYAPLLLTTRVPERLSAVVACEAPGALATDAGGPVTILATSRDPAASRGLVISDDGRQLVIAVGERIIAKRSWPTGAVASDCAHTLTVEGKNWSLTGGAENKRSGGSIPSTPIVNGVFSEVELTGERAPAIEITTRVHDVRPTSRQHLAWTLAALCALLALRLVAVEARAAGSAAGAPRPAIRRRLGRPHAVDAFVVLALSTWWIIEPAFFDDGWAVARQRSLATSGGFSNYFEPYGASLPLGYWHDWLMHFVTDWTNQLSLQRLPALLTLLTVWAVTRYAFAQTHAPAARARSTTWALAVSFVLVAVAWGISLRQESVVALCLAVVIICTARFVITGSAAPLALVAAVVPLSLTVHPAGIVAIAPLLAVTPIVYRWIRSSPASAVALLVASSALALTLGFVGSDVEQRALDANAIGHGATTGAVGWRNELVRYSVVILARNDDVTGWSTPLRRGSVALILLAAAAVLARYRRFTNPLSAIAAYTLPITLALLVVTPSKWPWHFGALVAPTALAAAAATAVFRGEQEDTRSWRPRAFLMIGVLTAAIAWSWSTRVPWNPLDLRTLDWSPRFETWLSITAVAVLAPTVFLVVAWARARSGGRSTYAAPWRTLTWWAPLLSVPLIAFTTAVLIADAARTPDWTPSRANLSALWGDTDCGLAEDLLAPARVSMRSSPPLSREVLPNQVAPWVPLPPHPGLDRYALGPIREGASSTPWFPTRRERMAVYVSGRAELRDRLLVEWGRRDSVGFRSLASTELRLRSTAEQGATIPWRFVPIDRRQRGSRGATAMRITLVNSAPPGGAVAVTAPVTYAQEPLVRRFAAGKTLVIANVATFFPCAGQPPLHHGVVDVPSTLITTRDSVAPVRYPGTTPFAGLLDIYPVAPLPLRLPEGRPENLLAFDVDTDLPGAVLVAPERQTTVD